LRGVLGHFLVGLLAGALVAPWVFRLLVGSARRGLLPSTLRDLDFESVASRCVLITLIVVGLIGAWRARGTALPAVGLGRAPVRGRQALSGFLFGACAMASLWLTGWAGGAFVWTPPEAAVLGQWPVILLGALLVGVVEETLFRGVLFGALRRYSGFWAAALLSSLAYSVVHFANPEPFMGVAHAHWDSGLRLLGSLFRWPHAVFHYFPMLLTLVFLGLGLCRLFEAFGALYAAMGLHAGVVFVMRAGEDLFQRQPDVWPFWYGGTEGVPKTYAALLMAITVCLLLWPITAAAFRAKGADG
jgi:membrane protease YdiL (CAAX protease family)